MLNGAPCFHTTMMAVIQLFASFPAMLFSSHRTQYINNYINNKKEKEIKLLNPLTISMNFRWAVNLGMQFIDITSHPLKNMLMKASVFRLLVPSAIVEENVKVADIKKSLLINNGDSTSFVKRFNRQLLVALSCASLVLLAEYANTYIDIGEENYRSVSQNPHFYFNIALKSGRLLALLIPSISLVKETQYNHDFRKFIAHGSVRTASSLTLVPLFEMTNSLRYVSLLTAVDILLTAISDRECGNAMEHINNQTSVYYSQQELMKLYKEVYDGNFGKLCKIISQQAIINDNLLYNIKNILKKSYKIISEKREVKSNFLDEINVTLKKSSEIISEKREVKSNFLDEINVTLKKLSEITSKQREVKGNFLDEINVTLKKLSEITSKQCEVKDNFLCEIKIIFEKLYQKINSAQLKSENLLDMAENVYKELSEITDQFTQHKESLDLLAFQFVLSAAGIPPNTLLNSLSLLSLAEGLKQDVYRETVV